MSSSRLRTHYEICVEGVLGECWACWFEGLQVSSAAGETIISGPLAGQSALHRVLVKVRDLGMCLISVRRLAPAPELVILPAHEPIAAGRLPGS
jgi:hypothetical protein